VATQRRPGTWLLLNACGIQKYSLSNFQDIFFGPALRWMDMAYTTRIDLTALQHTVTDKTELTKKWKYRSLGNVKYNVPFCAAVDIAWVLLHMFLSKGFKPLA
jgi:hypothetical protein